MSESAGESVRVEPTFTVFCQRVGCSWQSVQPASGVDAAVRQHQEVYCEARQHHLEHHWHADDGMRCGDFRGWMCSCGGVMPGQSPWGSVEEPTTWFREHLSNLEVTA